MAAHRSRNLGSWLLCRFKGEMTEFAAKPVPIEVDKNSEKIDMSLDDIIELNKRENNSATTAVNRTREQQKRQWNLRPRNPQIQPGQGMQQNIQGSGRPRRNASGSQGYGGINRYWQTQARSPRIRPDGKRPAPVSKRQIAPIRKTRITPGRAQQVKKSFRPTRQGPPQILKRRIMFQNKISTQQKKQQTRNQQRQTKANIKRGFLQMGLGAGQKKQWTPVWRQRLTTSSILTISVPNPQANQPPAQRLRSQQSLTGRKQMTIKGVRKQPKGVYLGFNFKSIANQTSVTLNDRFSSMKICPCPAASRRGGRTVTMG
ncbi:UAP56-interacting factor isoform X2 [Pristis pectinata]|uniref:UAP56-interacting factor isoform X2 n=1 Tax=Pristis pectinata TaxID=685728 RepID=UPI00223E0A95|nr:UAP56-interacting factor isoform X2 [Pristis pectinata]